MSIKQVDGFKTGAMLYGYFRKVFIANAERMELGEDTKAKHALTIATFNFDKKVQEEVIEYVKVTLSPEQYTQCKGLLVAYENQPVQIPVKPGAWSTGGKEGIWYQLAGDIQPFESKGFVNKGNKSSGITVA